MECAIRRQLPFRYRFYTVFSEISFLTFALHSQKSGGCAPPIQRTLQQKDADSPRRMHSPLLVKSMTCMWRSTSVSVRASLSAGKCANNHLVHPTFCCTITREFYQFRMLFRSRLSATPRWHAHPNRWSVLRNPRLVSLRSPCCLASWWQCDLHYSVHTVYAIYIGSSVQASSRFLQLQCDGG